MQTPEAPSNHYTFGDSSRASARLRRLAEMYEPETRGLLTRSRISAPRLAVDLGCGPGWSTRLLRDTLTPERTVGLDASAAFIAEARGTQGPELEFEVHDIVRTPFPVRSPDVMLCRFLLTHLAALPEVLTAWAQIAAPGGWLLVHETEALETEHPALRRYYELVADLQRHHGQILTVGAILEVSFAGTGWNLIESERHLIEKPVRDMAELHLANLRTWRNDDYARHAFDQRGIDELDATLGEIVDSRSCHGVVINAARQIVARRA